MNYMEATQEEVLDFTASFEDNAQQGAEVNAVDAVADTTFEPFTPIVSTSTPAKNEEEVMETNKKEEEAETDEVKEENVQFKPISPIMQGDTPVIDSSVEPEKDIEIPHEVAETAVNTSKLEALKAVGIEIDKLAELSDDCISVTDLCNILGIEKKGCGMNFDKRQLHIIEKYGDKAEKIKEYVTPDMDVTEIVYIANKIADGDTSKLEMLKGVRGVELMEFICSVPDNIGATIHDSVIEGVMYNVQFLKAQYRLAPELFEQMLPFAYEFTSYTAILLFIELCKITGNVLETYNKWGTDVYDLMLALDKNGVDSEKAYYVCPRDGKYALISE